MISVYEAILRAADTIEQNPSAYDFRTNSITDCNTPHCMVGWIGFHLGMSGKRVQLDVMPLLGLNPLIVHIGDQMMAPLEAPAGYVYNAALAVGILRHFAKRFAPTHTGIPSAVRAIFTEAVQS